MLQPAILAEFQKLAELISTQLTREEQQFVEKAVRAQPKRSRTYGFEDLGSDVVTALSAMSLCPKDREAEMSRCVISRLCGSLADRFPPDMPNKVFERANAWLEYLFGYLSGGPASHYAYPADAFLKDYRFAAGMTVPCGAQVVDLAERPGLKTFVALLARDTSLAWNAVASPWFRPHTESRYLDEFNEEGWSRCYREVVDLFEVRPNVAGLIATSWFYDPRIAEISPRLAYLQQTPIENGALALRHGTTPFDIQSATATSPTRREMHEQGKYMPECWSIIWPRERMLEWSRS